jgi:hypothetical protein
MGAPREINYIFRRLVVASGSVAPGTLRGFGSFARKEGRKEARGREDEKVDASRGCTSTSLLCDEVIDALYSVAERSPPPSSPTKVPALPKTDDPIQIRSGVDATDISLLSTITTDGTVFARPRRTLARAGHRSSARVVTREDGR